MSEFKIQQALCPRVAILSSPDVDQVVQLNRLADFATLLRPFEESVERLSVRTSQLETRLCERFSLRFDNLSVFQRPPSAQDGSQDILDVVTAHINANTKRWDAQVDKTHLVETFASNPAQPIEAVAPWFTHFRDLVFKQRFPSSHETFGHPVAVLVAVSSTSPDPMNEFARLYEIASSPKLFETHPYMDLNMLNYYVLIHDVRTSGDDLSPSLELLDQVKKTYGLHCCLLPINSASADSPPPSTSVSQCWSQIALDDPSSFQQVPPNEIARYLDEEDVKRLKGFVRELTAQSIVPFMERCVQQWNEQLATSRKGLTGRLFGASRKFFASGKTSSQSTQSPGYNVQHDYYPYTAIEAQTRRLADFAFTIRDYKLAASMYDLGRKDFSGDKAWRHSAGATEMFGLSHLMIMYTTRTPPIDVDSYLSQACHEYSLKPSRENSALRATLLYLEAYRTLHYLRPAPAALVRMANMSDEVFAALLLEQAALADLQLPKPALRKHALHLVMAGHRYEACGQKTLSLRCYSQAAAIYQGKSWTLIENHLQRKLGMQAYNEGDSQGAVSHLITLLRPSHCSAEEHETFLREILTAYKYAGSDNSDTRPKLQLPQPIFDPAGAKLRVTDSNNLDAFTFVHNSTWQSLEKSLLEHGFNERVLPDGSKLVRKKPLALASSSNENSVSTGQTFWLDLEARNPLNIAISLQDIRPQLVVAESKSVQAAQTDMPESEATVMDEMEVDDVGVIHLGPQEIRRIVIPLRVNRAESIRVARISFVLAESLMIQEPMEKRGKRINKTKEQRINPTYAPDTTLAMLVHKPRPTLVARLESPPTSLIVGEEKQVKFILRNEGPLPVTDIRVLCSRPDTASFEQGTVAAAIHQTGDSVRVDNDLFERPPHQLADHGTTLGPLQEMEFSLVLRGSQPGSLEIGWLISGYCADDDNTYTARLAHVVYVTPALEVAVQCRPSDGLECSYELLVEAANVSFDVEAQVTGISVSSAKWQLDPRTDGIQSITKATLGQKLLPGQVWKTRLSISKSLPLSDVAASDNNPTPTPDLEFTIDRLQSLVFHREIKSSGRPPAFPLTVNQMVTEQTEEGEPTNAPSRFLHLSLLILETRQMWRRNHLATHFPTMSEQDRIASFTLYEPGDLDVTIHFTACQHPVLPSEQQQLKHAQIHVFGIQPAIFHNQLRRLLTPTNVTTIRSMYAQTAKEKASLLHNLLTSYLAIDQNPIVFHTIPKYLKSNIIAVDFQIRNFSSSLSTQIEIQLIDQKSLFWLGRKTFKTFLLPQNSITLSLSRLCIDTELTAETEMEMVTSVAKLPFHLPFRYSVQCRDLLTSQIVSCFHEDRVSS